MLCQKQNGERRGTGGLRGRNQAVLFAVQLRAHFAVGISAHALPPEQGRHVRDFETVCHYYEPADPDLVHNPAILPVQVDRSCLLRRLPDGHPQELQYDILGAARAVHSILYHRPLLRLCGPKNCMHFYYEQARNGIREEEEPHYE